MINAVNMAASEWDRTISGAIAHVELKHLRSADAMRAIYM